MHRGGSFLCTDQWGNLYHLNANEDLEDPDRPTNPEFRKEFDPRGIISGTADGKTVDEGPLTVKRMETFDDEVAAKSRDFLDRRAKANKPFFLWHNSTRQHVFIHLKQAAEGQSRAGKEDVYGNGLKGHDGQVGQLLDKLAQTGLDKNTIVIYTTDNGAYQYMWSEGGTSLFKGDKGTTWESGVRVPFMIRWPVLIDMRRVIGIVIANWTYRIRNPGCLWFKIVAESKDNIGVDRLFAGDRQGVVPEIIFKVYPPVIGKLHPEALVGIRAGRRPMPQVLKCLAFVEEDHIIAPEHEFVSQDSGRRGRDGCRVRREVLIHSRRAGGDG